MKLLSRIFAVVGVLILTIGSTGLAQQWNQGNPTADEQYTLEQINRLRRDGAGWVDRYINKPTVDPVFRQLAYVTPAQADNGFTVDQKLAGMVSTFRTLASGAPDGIPVGPLALYPVFTQKAAEIKERTQAQMSADPGTVNVSQWTSALATPAGYVAGSQLPRIPTFVATNDSLTVYTQANATGGSATLTTTANRLAYGSYVIANLYDPQITAREVIFDANDLPTSWLYGNFGAARPPEVSGHARMIGITVGTRNNAPNVRCLTTFTLDNECFSVSDLPYGTVNTAFVTGVAYQDSNNNGEYDIGEGIGGLNVSLNNSTWFAVTGTAGGFAIPVRVGSGPVTVTFKTNAGAVVATSTVTVGNDSVKVDYMKGPSKVTQVPVAASDGTTQIINLSTLGFADAGANALIGGFVISGTGQKTVLIRGMGLSLYSSFNIKTALLNPSLTVYDSNSRIIASQTTAATYADNKANGPITRTAASVGAFAFADNVAGSGVGDVALVLTLPPGSYTAQINPDPVRAVGGVVIFELYDVSQSDGSRLIDVATRGSIQTGSNQMTVGFAIRGSGNRRVLVRGVGPGLASFGVPGTLNDPAITLYNNNSVPIATNNDWWLGEQADQLPDLSASVGAFALPFQSSDAALIARLTPGNYTAIVAPQTNSGLGIVEVYETP